MQARCDRLGMDYLAVLANSLGVIGGAHGNGSPTAERRFGPPRQGPPRVRAFGRGHAPATRAASRDCANVAKALITMSLSGS